MTIVVIGSLRGKIVLVQIIGKYGIELRCLSIWIIMVDSKKQL